MAALTTAVGSGELLMEHVYPAKPEALSLMKQTLTVGLQLKLERTHDVSSVIHAERLIDGRILVTAIPLLYGSYTVTRGLGTFRLDRRQVSIFWEAGRCLSHRNGLPSNNILPNPGKKWQKLSLARSRSLVQAQAPLRRLQTMNWCASSKPGQLQHLARPHRSSRAIRNRRQCRKAKKVKSKNLNLRRRQRPLPRQ